MQGDKELLKAIKEEFWWFMDRHEQRAWNQYWRMVNTQGYDLSKKNLTKLETIINNIQIRREQAKLPQTKPGYIQ